MFPGVADKYTQCAEKNDEDPSGMNKSKTVINCFTVYSSTTYQELYIYLTCFFILPVAYGAIYYTVAFAWFINHELSHF
jgi:hypothetical protein